MKLIFKEFIFTFFITVAICNFFPLIKANGDSSNVQNTSNIKYITKGVGLYRNYKSNKPIRFSTDYNTEVLLENVTKNGRSKISYNNDNYYVKTSYLSNLKTYNENYGVTHYTRYDMQSMLNDQNEKYAQLPNFDRSNIKNIPGAFDKFNKEYLGDRLDVWDNWPLKNKNGTIANYHGYHIMFALAGNTDHMILGFSKIYMFYQKINEEDSGIDSWHTFGPVFMSNKEGIKDSSNSKLLKTNTEWSGASVLDNLNDNSVRLFYTADNTNGNKQYLAVSKLIIKKNKNGLFVDHKRTSDRKIIFSGDGKYYDTYKNFKKMNLKYDAFSMRDPSYIEANGKKYLTFVASTGYKDSPVGLKQLYNRANFGGDYNFFKNQQNILLSNDKLKEEAISSNAAIGLIELNNDFTVKKVLRPLVVFNTVSDEFERPSIIFYKNKWYMFTIGHGYHIISPNIPDTSSYLLGFSSNKINGKYKPLNKNGLVMYAYTEWGDPAFSYSYSVIQSNSNKFVMNSYMNSIKNHSNGLYTTFGNSVLLEINDNKTNIIKNHILQQGQLTYNE